MYDQGGRKFWIHNTGPLGCLPQKLSLVPKKPGDLDPYGCLSAYNDVARLFNEGLRHLCQEMRSKLKDSTIVYVDIFAIKYDLIANSTKHGKLESSLHELGQLPVTQNHLDTTVLPCRFFKPINGVLWLWWTAIQLQQQGYMWAAWAPGLQRRVSICKLGWNSLYWSCQHHCCFENPFNGLLYTSYTIWFLWQQMIRPFGKVFASLACMTKGSYRSRMPRLAQG